MAECLQDDSLTHQLPDVVFVRPRQARLLHHGPAKIVLLTLREIDRIITQLAQTRSKAEFTQLRKKVFSDYANLSYIMANSFSIPDDRSIRQAAIRQAFQTVQRLFETAGVSRLGIEVTKESIFCIDTLRKAYRLLDLLHSSGSNVVEDMRESDRKLASRFANSALWAQMHLDCLRLIIRQRTGLDQEVLDEILQGLRLAVMAYAYVREGIELRIKREPYLLDIQQDDEDRELLEESFLDRESTLDAES